MSPRLSVVVPCLALDDLTREAVRSLHDNELAPRMEVVVVVDGPHDPGADRVGSRPPGVDRVLCTGRRSGSAAATNLGFRHARGALLARMDGDDVSLPGRLDHEVRLLDEQPGVLAVGGAGGLVDGAGRRIGAYPACPDGDLRATLLTRNPVVHSSLVVRREVVRAVGGYDEACVRMQDYDLLLRIARRGVVWGVGSRPLVDYRVHAGQTSRYAAGTVRLMATLTRERSRLASELGRHPAGQHARNAVFVAAQLARYAGLRPPRYLRGVDDDAPSPTAPTPNPTPAPMPAPAPAAASVGGGRP